MRGRDQPSFPSVPKALGDHEDRIRKLEFALRGRDTIAANITTPGTQTITNGSFVPVTFDTVLWDTGGLADLGTHNDRLTVQDDGLYLVHGEAIWFANADSAYRNTICQSYTSGGVLSSSWAQSFANVNGENTIQNPSGPLQLTAGMYVRLLVYNGAGASRTLGAVYLSLTSL